MPSRTRRARAQPEPPPAPPPTRRVALLIGNGKVGDGRGGYALELPGIDRDLAGLEAVLGDAAYGGFEVVKLWQPTLLEARREIARVTRSLGSQDTLVLYYSGTSTVGRDGQLYLPVCDSDVEFLEATCLDADYVLGCLRGCASRQQLLMMDGCHAGAFFVANRGIPDGFCAIMACGPEEYSYGDADGGDFTKLLLEGLRGARADLDGDGVVTSEELYDHVRARAAARDDGRATTPQLWTWNLPQPIRLVAVRQKVFVSYRRADSAAADAVLARLEAEGYGVWLDRSDIEGGKRWRIAIEQALQDCDAVVFMISQAALQSDEVYKELVRALELGKPIVPLRLDEAPLYGWFNDKLGALQHIAYDPKDAAQAWWPRLARALRQARRATMATGAAPAQDPTAGRVAAAPRRGGARKKD